MIREIAVLGMLVFVIGALCWIGLVAAFSSLTTQSTGITLVHAVVLFLPIFAFVFMVYLLMKSRQGE